MNEPQYTSVPNGRSVGDVIAEIKQEIKDFAETRVRMFLQEMRETLQKSKKGAIYGGGALVLLGTAYLLLNLALVGLIAVAFWGSPYAWFFAFLIVGVFWLIVGGLFAVGAIRQFHDLAPRRTIEVLKQDKVWLRQEARNQV
jgi:uncharacterized membrane protein YqjE